jgi:hypothetical protein
MQKSVLNLIVVCACGGRVPDCHRRRGERTPMLDVLRWGTRVDLGLDEDDGE